MAIYYIDKTSGSDSNDGLSEANAWETVSKVNSSGFSAGDSVLFKCGEIWREQLSFPNDGTSGNEITIGAYGYGDQPIISGMDLLTTWTVYSENIYQASYTESIDTFLLVEDGVIATKVANVESISSAGEYFPDNANNIIYYWASDDADPDTHTMEIGARYDAINLTNRKYLIVRDLRITGGGGEWGAGLRCLVDTAVPQNIVIENCEVDTSYNAGIWFSHKDGENGMQNITVTNCNIHNNHRWGLFIEGENVTDNFTDIVVTENKVHDNCSASNGTHGIHLRFLSGVLVEHNEIYNNEGSLDWSSGLYLDTSKNTEICRNYSHDNHYDNFHIDVFSNGFDCHHNLSSGADSQGYMMEEHYVADGTSKLNNNTSYKDGRGIYFGPGGTDHTVSGVTVKNNIVAEPLYSCIGIDASMGDPISNNFNNTVDNNCYYVTGVVPVGATISPNETYDLAGWRTLTSFDANSFVADPDFIDGTNYDLRIIKGSECINSGENLSYTEDYQQNAITGNPEVGAYEYNATFFDAILQENGDDLLLETGDKILLDQLLQVGLNMQVNIGDDWKEVLMVQINIGDEWKEVTKIQQNIGDDWKEVS